MLLLSAILSSQVHTHREREVPMCWLANSESGQQATDAPADFKLLYDVSAPIEDKIETIVKEIYRGDGIEISEKAAADIARYKAQGCVSFLCITPVAPSVCILPSMTMFFSSTSPCCVCCSLTSDVFGQDISCMFLPWHL
eukprot:m.523424 g.523424  ORF g.523424 m.523424 type:complete len:140 (+) comp21977_c1_seq8:939-1358(+)